MVYKIIDTGEVFDDIDDVIDHCITEDYHYDDEYFEEWLNESYEHVTINGTTYYPYDILSAVDDDNFSNLRDAYCEYCNDDDRDNARYELNHAEKDEIVWIQDSRVVVLDEETLRRQEEELENNRILEDKQNEEDLLLMFAGE